MKLCGNCEHFYSVPPEIRRNAGIPSDAQVGFCYGHPPTVQIVPVPDRGMLNPNGQQNVRLAQQNLRAVMMENEKACSLWRPVSLISSTASN
jgi:hypothetical protein